MQKSLVLDWVQIHVSLPTFYEVEKIGYTNDDLQTFVFEVAQKQPGKMVPFEVYVKSDCCLVTNDHQQTQQFINKWTITDKETGEEIAVLVANPRKGFIFPENDGILKVTNKYLYQKDFSDFLRQLLAELHLNFCNYVRVDIALDFLQFDTMSAPDFIKGFTERRYMKRDKCKFAAYGETWSVDRGGLTGGFETLKFGMETSENQYKLYNKTKEMTDKKIKPWIADNWANNGWDGVSDVWRLEFVIKNTTKGIVIDTDTVLSMKDFDFLEYLEMIYKHYFSMLFNFVNTEHTKKGNLKKQSRCKPVVLFESWQTVPVTINLSIKKDGGRASKIFAHALMRLNQELRGQDFDLSIQSFDVMSWIIETRGLKEWFAKRYPYVLLSKEVSNKVDKGRNALLQSEIGQSKKGKNHLKTV